MRLRKFITFIQDLFSVSTDTGGRRLKSYNHERTPSMMRGALMRAARHHDIESHIRFLQSTEEPLLAVELNELISLTFDFNFGEGSKDLLFGVQFHYDSGDSLSDS